jgi:hypothetical protein
VRNWVRISFWDRVELLLPLIRRSANSAITRGFGWQLCDATRPLVRDAEREDTAMAAGATLSSALGKWDAIDAWKVR